MITHHLDFTTLLALSGALDPSVIQLRGQGTMPSDIGTLILSVLERFAAQLATGAVVSVDTVRFRVRLLPIAAPENG